MVNCTLVFTHFKGTAFIISGLDKSESRSNYGVSRSRNGSRFCKLPKQNEEGKAAMMECLKCFTRTLKISAVIKKSIIF